MDVVSLALSKGYTNEKLNSLPSNTPTKTVTFDGGIYSVGNDVVNGQISVTMKGRTVRNILNDNLAKCETITSWATYQTERVLDTVNKYEGTNCIKITLGTGYSSGTIFSKITSLLDKTKYYLITGHIKNGNLSGIGIRFGVNCINDAGNILSGAITSTNYVRAGVVVKPSDFDTATEVYFYILVNGAENQYAYLDAIMVNEITAEEYALGADALIRKYNWHTGTKSTNSVRIRSVNEDETKESIAYVNLPQGEELRSLPNGTYDEIDITRGKLIGRTGKTVLNGNEDWNHEVTGDLTYRFLLKNWKDANNAVNISPNGDNAVEMNDDAPYRILYHAGDDERCLAIHENGNLYLRVEKNKLDSFSGATAERLRTYLNQYPVTLIYQLAEPIITKLPAQPPLQVYENGTVYVEPIGDPAETTLPSVEMTIPTGTSNKFGVATHNYGGAAADWELTNSESKCFLLAVSNAGGAANIIAPNRPGTMYAISNASGHTITIKISGGNGVDVNTGKKVLVIHNGTDYTALTAEL